MRIIPKLNPKFWTNCLLCNFQFLFNPAPAPFRKTAARAQEATLTAGITNRVYVIYVMMVDFIIIYLLSMFIVSLIRIAQKNCLQFVFEFEDVHNL